MALVYTSNEREICVFDARNPAGGGLHIARPDGELAFAPINSASTGKPVAGILGIIRLRLTKYVIFVTKAREVGRILGHPILQATDFDLVPLREWRIRDDSEKQYLGLVEKHLHSGSIFFSYELDITSSFQRQASQGAPQPGQFLWERADPRFFWNYYVSADLMDAAARDRSIGAFVLPVVYGVFSESPTTINGEPSTFGIITRRSRFRAGTRYFRRGIDADGNVANYNETEQFVVIKGRLYAYVQTRGSVPIFWGEVNNMKYRPMLRVGGAPVDAARRHFDEQERLYGRNWLVNLVNQNGYEKAIKDGYEGVVAALGDPQLDYTYFDFHHECSGMRWHRVQILIDHLVSRGLSDQGWFEASLTPDGTAVADVLARQSGVVRTNCMDCLDRTNVVQSQIAKWVLQRQLEESNVLPPGRSWELDTHFLFVFRNIWADNADGVSCTYSGTGALKTDFTRTGKRTKLGALSDLRNSIARYILNNCYDGPRQDSFDLFLGNHLPYETVDPPFFDARPLLTQSMPYVVLGSAIMAGAGILFPKEDNPILVSRLFVIFWVFMFALSLRSVFANGLQYVNWPKLVPLDFVTWHEKLRNGISRGWEVIEAGTGSFNKAE